MKFITILLFLLFSVLCFSQDKTSSVFMGHILGYQATFNQGFNTESLNSSAFLAFHNKNNIVIGGVASLNVLLKIPVNEVGFVFGYSDDKFLGLINVKSYNTQFENESLGVQGVFGYTFEFQKNVGIGPSVSGGAIFPTGGPQYHVSVGILVKQLKPR